MSYQLKQRQSARVRWRSGRAACRTGRPGLAFSVPAKVLMATPCDHPALIHWEVKVGGTSMKDVGSAVLEVRRTDSFSLFSVFLFFVGDSHHFPLPLRRAFP